MPAGCFKQRTERTPATMTSIKARCPLCRKSFPHNPKKHQFRTKLTPCCRAPYTQAKTWFPTFDFRKLARSIQKAFSFSGSSKKVITWVCSTCNKEYEESEFVAQRYPDKYRTLKVNGELQHIPVSYREVPTCRKCNTHLTRRSKKILEAS